MLSVNDHFSCYAGVYYVAVMHEGAKVWSEEESSMRILMMMYLWSDPTQQVS